MCCSTGCSHAQRHANVESVDVTGSFCFGALFSVRGDYEGRLPRWLAGRRNKRWRSIPIPKFQGVGVVASHQTGTTMAVRYHPTKTVATEFAGFHAAIPVMPVTHCHAENIPLEAFIAMGAGDSATHCQMVKQKVFPRTILFSTGVPVFNPFASKISLAFIAVVLRRAVVGRCSRHRSWPQACDAYEFRYKMNAAQTGRVGIPCHQCDERSLVSCTNNIDHTVVSCIIRAQIFISLRYPILCHLRCLTTRCDTVPAVVLRDDDSALIASAQLHHSPVDRTESYDASVRRASGKVTP